LDNRAQTDQHEQEFEEICQFPVGREPFDRPEADGTDHDNDQNADQNRNSAHTSPSLAMDTIEGLTRAVKAMLQMS
jgi:hypothetical protein